MWSELTQADQCKGCPLWGAHSRPCPLLEQVIFSLTFNTQTSLIWFPSWSQMGIRACKQMISGLPTCSWLLIRNKKECWRKHRNYCARGWATCSAHHCVFPLHSRALLQVTWTIGKFVPWAYLTCTYRDFFFCYRSSLHFAKGSLADLPWVVALGFTLPRHGAQGNGERVYSSMPQLHLQAHHPLPCPTASQSPFCSAHTMWAKLW